MGDQEQAVIAVKAISSIGEVDAAAWDACAGGDHPFVRHAFLDALERSGSVSGRTGWAPYHLVIEGERQELIGAVPMYLKSHSYGEFVFDHGWAAAYERAGGDYYPKLLVAVPFTPVTGPRLLIRPGPESAEVERYLLAGCIEVGSRHEVSSLHINFLDEDLWQRLGEAGLLRRTGEQFHWVNEGYESFDDFLAALSSRKRKTIRRERRDALAENGISIEVLRGSDLTEAHWDAFFAFYLDTGSRKWGSPYLNREFFSLLSESMGDHVALFMAKRGGRYIAGALNLIGADALYGRYWGCNEEHRFLHFELCYYQAIDYAIHHRLGRVEAGAQGPHKLQRGYAPVRTYSAHWIRDRGFHEAVARYLEQERQEVDFEIDWLSERTPFRKSDPAAEPPRGGHPEDEPPE